MGGSNCEICGGWMLDDHSHESVGPVCVNCGRPSRTVSAEVLASLAAERRPNRKIGPGSNQPTLTGDAQCTTPTSS